MNNTNKIIKKISKILKTKFKDFSGINEVINELENNKNINEEISNIINTEVSNIIDNKNIVNVNNYNNDSIKVNNDNDKEQELRIRSILMEFSKNKESFKLKKQIIEKYLKSFVKLRDQLSRKQICIEPQNDIYKIFSTYYNDKKMNNESLDGEMYKFEIPLNDRSQINNYLDELTPRFEIYELKKCIRSSISFYNEQDVLETLECLFIKYNTYFPEKLQSFIERRNVNFLGENGVYQFNEAEKELLNKEIDKMDRY